MKTISSTAMPAGRIAAFGLGLALMVALLVLLAPRPAYAATFTVNQTGDAKDRNINNSVCDVSRKNGNQCTLRAAIEEANNTPGADTINFNIGGTASVKTIKPAKQLPEITEAVTINGYSQPGASENTLEEGNDAVLKVQLNGTDAGTAHGLVVQASGTTIKGLVINRFAGNGVLISGSSATDNKILGNFIGTNAAGTADLGNGGEGVEIFNASENTVGGAREAARNVISGNTDDGVEFQGATLGNEVLGNYIGTNASGTEALGNGDVGVHILGEGNTIGGTFSGARNVISGNGGHGVDLLGVNTKDNKIEGNFIGTKASSTQDLGNGEDGVNLTSGAFDNTIGGTASGAGNRIAHNDQDGVAISSTSTGNRVLSNSIFSNTGLGIDLVGGTEDANGVTANDIDDDDDDTGANNLQNFPVITSATRSNTTGFTTIIGTLNSNPSQSFTIQCFLTDGAPATTHGEGLVPLGTTTTTTGANGDSPAFACPGTPIPVPGQTVSMTATNTSGTATDTAIGDTSEFSQNVGVVPSP